MKTLQNNFTTPEQSKRLLELGVPADSADCYRISKDGMVWIRTDIDKIDWSSKVGNTYNYYPCWSVGRLMEILMICNIYLAPKEFMIEPDSMNPTLIENVVYKIEELVGYDMLDFSKLEEEK